MTENWREETDGFDYFLHQQKKGDLADRRPVIRKASDLVGPGVSGNTVRISDFNDLLATFNGFYSALPGATSAPNSTEAFVGYVISDAELGGKQVFTGLTSGIEYTRSFDRSPTDPESLGWSDWTGFRVPPTATGYTRSETLCQQNVPKVLTPPVITVAGEAGVYESSSGGIRLRRQGVYTGHIQVGDYTGGSIADLYINIPDQSTLTQLGQLGQSLGPTVYIPFTVRANDGEQGFSVTALLTNLATSTLWWRFSCTRVGDAV